MLNSVHKLFAVYRARTLVVYVYLAFAGVGWGQETPFPMTDPVLEALISEAINQDPDLLRQRLVITERTAAVDLAAANRRPTVDLRADYILSAGGRISELPIGDLLNPVYGTLNQLTGAGEGGFPTNLANEEIRFIPSNFHDTRLEATLPLLAPQIEREVALRRAQVREAEAGAAPLRNQLRFQVRDFYYAYQEATTGLRITASARTALDEVLRINRSLLRNDKITADAVYRTEAEIAQLDAQSAQLAGQQRSARAALNRLLGRELSLPLPTDTTALRLPDPSTRPDPAHLRTAAQTQRPELTQLQRGSESLDRLADLQDAERLPTLGLRAQAGAQGFFNGDFNDHPYFTLGAGFSWNLYDGNRRAIRVQQTRLQQEQLRQQTEATRRAVDLDVWQATEQVTAQQARLTAATAGIRAAREALRITERRYRNDQALLVEYLDARNQLTTAELTYALAQYGVLRAYAGLERAVGE